MVKLVTVLSENLITKYNRRVIKIQRKGEDRTVLHYQYTKWPDMGVINVADILDFRNKVLSEYNNNTLNINIKKHNYDSGLTVHCGAGCGRTGTYIAIDFLLKIENRLLSLEEETQQKFDFPSILNIDEVIENMRNVGLKWSKNKNNMK